MNREQINKVMSKLRARSTFKGRNGAIESYESALNVGTLEFLVDSTIGVLQVTQRPRNGQAIRVSSEYLALSDGRSVRTLSRMEREYPGRGFMTVSEMRLTNVRVGRKL